MHTLFSQIELLAGQNILFACAIMYFATIFLGNIGAFVSLWISFQGVLGVFGVPIVIVVIFCANVTGDMLWYFLGRSLRTTRLGGWLKRRAPYHDKIESHVTTNGRRWMLFGKFAYGTNFPLIFTIGWIQMPFSRFFRRSLLAIALWLPIIIGVSYGLFASLSPLAAIATIKQFEVYFLIALGLFIVLQILLGKAVTRFFGKGGEGGAK